jgi:hypothetical protein
MALPQLADVDYEEYVTDTGKASLFVIDGEEVWLPSATIEVDIDSKTITMPRWLAYKKGLI